MLFKCWLVACMYCFNKHKHTENNFSVSTATGIKGFKEEVRHHKEYIDNYIDNTI